MVVGDINILYSLLELILICYWKRHFIHNAPLIITMTRVGLYIFCLFEFVTKNNIFIYILIETHKDKIVVH